MTSSPSKATPDGGDPLDLDALERTAREATEGPWIHDDEPYGTMGQVYSRMTPSGAGHPGPQVAQASRGDCAQTLADADYIATFDPPTVLKLIALARATTPQPQDQPASGDISRAEQFPDDVCPECGSDVGHYLRCPQALPAAPDDRERLIWERDEAMRLMSQYAREADEAKGRLEMSEAAGMVDNWRDHALAADARRDAAEALVERLREVASEAISSMRVMADLLEKSGYPDTATQARKEADQLSAALSSARSQKEDEGPEQAVHGRGPLCPALAPTPRSDGEG